MIMMAKPLTVTQKREKQDTLRIVVIVMVLWEISKLSKNLAAYLASDPAGKELIILTMVSGGYF